MNNLEKYFNDLVDCGVAYKQIVGTMCRKKYRDKECVDCKKDIVEWLLEENDEPALTEKEKEYLSSFIKPFKNKISSISKQSGDGTYYIEICYNDGDVSTIFPYFEENDNMYRGMIVNKEYTVEELGLW